MVALSPERATMVALSPERATMVALSPERATMVAQNVNLDRWGSVVRRISIAIERTDTTVLLLTDGLASRAMPLPVALRLEIARGEPGRTTLRVAKDRHGRVGNALAIAV
jgi:hypothetical protein